MAVGLALVGAGWIAGWVLFARAPWLRTVAIAEPNVAVDVVIPARNEHARLPTLLGALSRQSYLAQRVIVVDGGSSDGTAELAHSARAVVVAPGPAPAGDTATGWARRQGAAAAGGEVLVFLDPGTEPAPEFLRRAVTEHLRLGGLLSIQPYRRMRRIRDRLVAFVDLVTAMAVGGMDATRTGGRVTGAFAACMVCHRADYVAVTGNVELRSIPGYPALARRFAGAGRAVHARLGRGAIELHPHGAAGPGRIDERAADLRAGLRSTPLPRMLGITLWGGRAPRRGGRARARARRPRSRRCALRAVRGPDRRVPASGRELRLADRAPLPGAVARVRRRAAVVAGAAGHYADAVIQSATARVATSRPSAAGNP